MGCASTKSVAVTSQGGAERPDDNQNVMSHNPEEGFNSEDEFVTLAEAVAYVQQELALDDVRAERMVKSVSSGNKVSCIDIVLLNERIKEIKETLAPKFQQYDPQGTGFVSPEVAVTIIMSEFKGLPETSAWAMVRQFDQDGNDQVDFCEFIEFYAFSKSKKGELENIFKKLDVDNSGDLDAEELIQVLINECCLKEVQARSLVEDFDADKNGTLDKAEFITMWTNLFG